MQFLSNVELPVLTSDTAATEGELQYNSTKGKFGGRNGSVVLDFVSEQILGSNSASEGASLIGIEDANGNYTSTELEGVLTEIDGRLKSVEQFKEALNSVNFNINYTKATAGAPTNDAGLVDGEICLVIPDNTYYTANSGAWDAGASFASSRGIFKDDGAATIAGLVSTADEKIYDGSDVSNPYTPDFGDNVAVESENSPNGRLYFFNGTNWIFASNLSAHNDLNNIQGGSATERYHLTLAEHTLVGNLPSNTASEGASLIGIETGTIGSATDVQGALEFLNTNSSKSQAYSVIAYPTNHTETYTHTFNTRNILVSVQEDDGGNPGEIVGAKVTAISNTQFTVAVRKAASLHVTVVAV